jgi:hypothetical protein
MEAIDPCGKGSMAAVVGLLAGKEPERRGTPGLYLGTTAKEERV